MKYIIILFVCLVGCTGIDYDGIDYYKVGDRVKLYGMADECYAEILEYVPIHKFKIKVICHQYTGGGSPIYIINDKKIEKRVE